MPQPLHASLFPTPSWHQVCSCFFSRLKRSLAGTFHHVTAQHLHRYVVAFDYRYYICKEKDGERTVRVIRKSARKPLMYKLVTDPGQALN